MGGLIYVVAHFGYSIFPNPIATVSFFMIGGFFKIAYFIAIGRNQDSLGGAMISLILMGAGALYAAHLNGWWTYTMPPKIETAAMTLLGVVVVLKALSLMANFNLFGSPKPKGH